MFLYFKKGKNIVRQYSVEFFSKNICFIDIDVKNKTLKRAQDQSFPGLKCVRCKINKSSSVLEPAALSSPRESRASSPAVGETTERRTVYQVCSPAAASVPGQFTSPQAGKAVVGV